MMCLIFEKKNLILSYQKFVIRIKSRLSELIRKRIETYSFIPLCVKLINVFPNEIWSFLLKNIKKLVYSSWSLYLLYNTSHILCDKYYGNIILGCLAYSHYTTYFLPPFVAIVLTHIVLSLFSTLLFKTRYWFNFPLRCSHSSA